MRTIFIMIGVSFLVCIGGNNNDHMYVCMHVVLLGGEREVRGFEDDES